MNKKVIIFVTRLFFSAMLFLTFFAEDIHNSFLPKVTAGRPETKLFDESIINENGETVTFSTDKIALTKEQLEQGVFVIYTAVKNGTERTFVRETPVITGHEKEGYYEILSGLMQHERIVITSTDEIYDGCEVILCR